MSLYEDSRLAELYDASNRHREDFIFCTRLASSAASVLDLGCGTGQLAASLAPGRRVCGVEPAGAMLDIARRREGGEAVEWIQADARTVHLGERFDLVLLTGHTFQVFLGDEDQLQVLTTIAAHLSRRGCFVFDTRNPATGVRENRSRHTYPTPVALSSGEQVVAWNESRYDPELCVLSYVNGYRFPDSNEKISATARIRYTSRSDLAARIDDAGLIVDHWAGTWRGDAFDERVSPEIIPTGRLPGDNQGETPRQSGRNRAYPDGTRHS